MQHHYFFCPVDGRNHPAGDDHHCDEPGNHDHFDTDDGRNHFDHDFYDHHFVADNDGHLHHVVNSVVDHFHIDHFHIDNDNDLDDLDDPATRPRLHRDVRHGR